MIVGAVGDVAYQIADIVAEAVVLADVFQPDSLIHSHNFVHFVRVLEVVPGAFAAAMTVKMHELLEMKESGRVLVQVEKKMVIEAGKHSAWKKIQVAGKEFEHVSSVH